MRKTNFEAYTSLLYYSAFHFSLSLSPSLSFIFGQENARKKRKTEWNSTTCNFAITNKLQITFCPKDIELIISFKFSQISKVTITIQKIFNIHRYLFQDLMANIRINLVSSLRLLILIFVYLPWHWTSYSSLGKLYMFWTLYVEKLSNYLGAVLFIHFISNHDILILDMNGWFGCKNFLILMILKFWSFNLWYLSRNLNFNSELPNVPSRFQTYQIDIILCVWRQITFWRVKYLKNITNNKEASNYLIPYQPDIFKKSQKQQIRTTIRRKLWYNPTKYSPNSF